MVLSSTSGWMVERDFFLIFVKLYLMYICIAQEEKEKFAKLWIESMVNLWLNALQLASKICKFYLKIKWFGKV